MGKVVVDNLKPHYEIEDTWFSFEIHPERPPAGEPARNRFGAAQYENMMRSLRSRGAELGISFCERQILANSRLAVEAAEYARDKGVHALFGGKVFQAYFTEGRNIGELDVILDVASDSGLDREEVRRVLAEGTYAPQRIQNAAEAGRLGIDSVPTFIINGSQPLVGAQPAAAFRSLFERLKRE